MNGRPATLPARRAGCPQSWLPAELAVDRPPGGGRARRPRLVLADPPRHLPRRGVPAPGPSPGQAPGRARSVEPPRISCEFRHVTDLGASATRCGGWPLRLITSLPSTRRLTSWGSDAEPSARSPSGPGSGSTPDRASSGPSRLLAVRAAPGRDLRLRRPEHLARVLRVAAHPGRLVGTQHRARARVPTRRPVVAAVPHRRRHRRPRARLLLRVLLRRGAGPGPFRRLPARLRRRDARPRHGRRPARALPVLGGHDGAELPAHRAPPREQVEPHRRHRGPRRDDLRRPGHARRPHHHRRIGRHLPAVPDPRGSRRRPARRRRRDGRRRRPRAPRGAEQVGARAVPLLAARRDGGAHPRQRLPARRRDGQGRHLPRRPVRARLCRRAAVAGARARPRWRDDDHRRLPLAAPVRPQAAARLRHREPARFPRRARRRRHRRRRARRRRDGARARPLQGLPVPRRRRHRPRDRHPRPARAVRARAHLTGPGDRRRRRGRLDGGPTAAARVRRQGGRLRRLHLRRTVLGLLGARGARRRLDADVRLQRAVRVGRLPHPARPRRHLRARTRARAARRAARARRALPRPRPGGAAAGAGPARLGRHRRRRARLRAPHPVARLHRGTLAHAPDLGRRCRARAGPHPRRVVPDDPARPRLEQTVGREQLPAAHARAGPRVAGGHRRPAARLAAAEPRAHPHGLHRAARRRGAVPHRLERHAAAALRRRAAAHHRDRHGGRRDLGRAGPAPHARRAARRRHRLRLRVAVPALRLARPRAHPGARRNPVDHRLRARAAPVPEPVHRRPPPLGPRDPGRLRPRRRRRRRGPRARPAAGPHRQPGLRRARPDRRRLRRRPQHGQHHPRRRAGLGHDG